MMKVERSQKYGSRNIKKKASSKSIFIVFIVTMIILAAIALYFSGFSAGKFFMLFASEVLGVILLFCVFLLSVSKGRKPSGNVGVQKIPADEEDSSLYMPAGGRRKTHKLIKLDKTNFNWSDEDISKKPKKVIQNNERQEEKTFHYRSPFEPINPPANSEQEQSGKQ
ncbi:MAG: hypothetical protein AB7G87_02995 [Clostridia bacterium]